MLRAKCDNVDILFNSDNVGTKVTFFDPGKAIDIFEMRNVLLTIKMLFIDESPVSLYLKKSDEKTQSPAITPPPQQMDPAGIAKQNLLARIRAARTSVGAS